MRFINNPPNATSLMSSARSFGNYDLPSALADLIDNSIKAKAKHVALNCDYNGGEPIVKILDDGEGMTEGELHAAMRPASTNPSLDRSPDDLGRFGWGMKSASFSQCKELTVITRKSGQTSGARWNLDDVSDWKMGVLDTADMSAESDLHFSSKKSGTEVIWKRCDRLSEEGLLSEDSFNEAIVHARERLALIFHRYLAGEVHGRKLSISLNAIEVAPFDPFHKSNNATQALEVELLRVGESQQIRIEPFVLPHFSKLSIRDHERLGGEEGFIKNQGFYIYRNHRLIMHGTWFRLVKHGELSQLARIAVDIPNSLDSMWKITVDKSDAQLPAALRARLKTVVEKIKRRGARVIRSKGGKVGKADKVTVWEKFARQGEFRYLINREHPMIASLLDSEDESVSGAARAAISLIEQNFPVIEFGADYGKNPDGIAQTSNDPRSFIEMLDAALPMALSNEGGDMQALVERLRITQPFSGHWKVVEGHLKAKGWING